MKELEERGWIYKYSHKPGVENYEKGNVWKDNGMGAFLKVDNKEGVIEIITTDIGFNQDGPNWSIKFKGECKDIKTFDIICNLIKLKI